MGKCDDKCGKAEQRLCSKSPRGQMRTVDCRPPGECPWPTKTKVDELAERIVSPYMAVRFGAKAKYDEQVKLLSKALTAAIDERLMRMLVMTGVLSPAEAESYKRKESSDAK